MNNVDIEHIIKDNLKDFISLEIDKAIQEATLNFSNRLLDQKDHYIEHIMKNIRVLHEYNHLENRIDYQITFKNVYEVGQKNAKTT